MRIFKVYTILLATIVTVFILSSIILADDKQEASVKTKHIFSSGVDAQPGDIKILEVQYDYRYPFKAYGELPVEVSLKVGHIDIDEDVPVKLPNQLEARRLGVGVKFPAFFIDDDRFFMGIDVFPTMNTDDYDWESGAFRIPSKAYLIFKESDDFILVAGVSVRPEYDSMVIPVLGLIYKPNDRLSFNLALDDPNITYNLTDKTKLLWEFDYTLEEYEVTRDRERHVVLKYRDFSTGVGIEHTFWKDVSIAVKVGGVFARRLEYKDDSGKVDPDAGIYTGARLAAKF